jgi:uncharacterized protein YjbI with pentapeptide repeats
MAAAPSPLRELAAAARGAEGFRLKTSFDLPGGASLEFEVRGARAGSRWNGYVTCCQTKGDSSKWTLNGHVTQPDDALRQLASKHPKAVLRPESVKVNMQKGTTTGAKARPIAVRAWYEAFGRPIPSPDEPAGRGKAVKTAKRTEADDVLALLATGRAGIKAFNQRLRRQISMIDLRGVDLANRRLDGIQLDGVNLDGADLSGASLVKAEFERWCFLLRLKEGSLKGAKFAGADLSKANLVNCKCAGTDFSRAIMIEANLRGGSFQRASFAGANLAKADFIKANLRGADFTGASMPEALFSCTTFDEHTKWPKGFPLPPELRWKGAGPDPRRAPTRRKKAGPKPTDFAGFLARLKKVADKSKLDKALAMLQADRFRLFAKIEADHLVGVVKSQSDPDLVYSCRLSADGAFSCCTQNLNTCGGLRGSPCKHLLVLIVGLAQAGELDPGTAHDWTQASRGRKPALDRDAMTETLLLYKGAEAGEVDWRPTETIPEDFYAL